MGMEVQLVPPAYLRRVKEPARGHRARRAIRELQFAIVSRYDMLRQAQHEDFYPLIMSL